MKLREIHTDDDLGALLAEALEHTAEGTEFLAAYAGVGGVLFDTLRITFDSPPTMADEIAAFIQLMAMVGDMKLTDLAIVRHCPSALWTESAMAHHERTATVLGFNLLGIVQSIATSEGRASYEAALTPR